MLNINIQEIAHLKQKNKNIVFVWTMGKMIKFTGHRSTIINFIPEKGLTGVLVAENQNINLPLVWLKHKYINICCSYNYKQSIQRHFVPLNDQKLKFLLCLFFALTYVFILTVYSIVRIIVIKPPLYKLLNVTIILLL